MLLYPVDPSFGHTLAPEPPALMTIPSECPWLAHGVQPRGPRVGTRRLQSSPAPGWPCQLRGDPEPPASVPQCRPCKMGSVAHESQGPEKSQQGCVHHASGTYPALVADRRPLPASRSRAALGPPPPQLPRTLSTERPGQSRSGGCLVQGKEAEADTRGLSYGGAHGPRGQGTEH